MKAILLAAGLGTRLRPITDEIPKCLVPINGKPLLAWWIELFEKHGITEFLINIHHLAEIVIDFISAYQGPINITYVLEPELLGSGGTLRFNSKFVADEKAFVIAYADNLTNYNLTSLINYHFSHELPFTMSLFRTDIPKQKGIAVLDDENTIIDFVEKPVNPKSNLANAGIYVAEPEILEYIESNGFADIGFDLLPKLVNNMKGWETEDFLMDIGTHEHLKKANNIWKSILQENYDSKRL